MSTPRKAPRFDPSRPHSARVYDYSLGGKNNFTADRELAEKIWASVPAGRSAAPQNRAFLGRAVRYLAAEEGIRQFLDIGAGLPAAGSVHETAQQAAPQSRVVYVDNDPLVISHAQAMLTGTPEGHIGYVQADLRDPADILEQAREVLDFTRPVALLLVAVLHLIGGQDNPANIVKALAGALPPGSFLAATHPSAEDDRQAWAAVERDCNAAGIRACWRDRDEFVQLAFAGLDLIPPGVVPVSQWRPDIGTLRPHQAKISLYGGVARKN